jgi:hypothetical protein
MQRRPFHALGGLQRLEPRLAPASIVNFTDLDGDRVRFTASKGDLTGRVVASPVPGVNFRGYYDVDLSDASFEGTNLTVSVTKGKTGDGLAIIGHINAGINNLGTVNIKGDLGDIDGGSGSPTVPALKALTVDSVGRFGQQGNGNREANIQGDVSVLLVKHNLQDSNFHVTGNLGSVFVGGSVIGGDAAGDGQIFASLDLGRVTVQQDLRGGNGDYTGFVGAGRNVGSVSVGGSVYGGKGVYSGDIYAAFYADGRIDKVTVGGSVVGGAGGGSGLIGGQNEIFSGHKISLGTVVIGKDLVGGSGSSAGQVWTGSLDRLTIKGSLVGGSNFDTGKIEVNAPDADNQGAIISILGGVYGGAGQNSGFVYFSTAGIDALTIGGSLIGGSGDRSGQVVTGSLGRLNLHGDVRGGSGPDTGRVIVTGSITSVVVGGSVVGGDVAGAGRIFASLDIGQVTIKHDLRGADGTYSGSVGAGVNLGSVSVGGSVYGGSGNNSGNIYAAVSSDGRIDMVTVGGSVVGGAGAISGVIGGIDEPVIGHKVSLGTVVVNKDLVGGNGRAGGMVWAYGGSLDRLTIKGSVVGGSGVYAGAIYVGTLNAAGQGATIAILGSFYGGNGDYSGQFLSLVRVDTLTVGGSLFGGSGDFSGLAYVNSGGLGLLKIHGDVRGGSGSTSGAVFVTDGITAKMIDGAVIPGTGPSSGTVTD